MARLAIFQAFDSLVQFQRVLQTFQPGHDFLMPSFGVRFDFLVPNLGVRFHFLIARVSARLEFLVARFDVRFKLLIASFGDLVRGIAPLQPASERTQPN